MGRRSDSLGRFVRNGWSLASRPSRTVVTAAGDQVRNLFDSYRYSLEIWDHPLEGVVAEKKPDSSSDWNGELVNVCFRNGLVDLEPILPNANIRPRLRAYQRFLSLVAFIAPTLQQDMLLYIGDGHPEYNEELPTQLVFNRSKGVGGPFVVIPDAHFVRARGYEKMRAAIDDARGAWDAKQSIAFWRGSSTGGHLGEGGDVRKNMRVQLCLAGRTDPDLVDARITRIVDCHDSAAAELDTMGVLGNYVSALEHLRYRYLVSVDGWGGEWEGMYWKLYSGSVVLMVESGFEQWYSELLEPWRHYVPVKKDLSDLHERIAWCRSNDLACRAIAERAVRLLRDHVNFAEAVRYTRRRITAG